MEFACNIASEMKGEFVEHVSSGMDTYSIRQPLGVRTSGCKSAVHSFSQTSPHRISWASLRCLEPCQFRNCLLSKILTFPVELTIFPRLHISPLLQWAFRPSSQRLPDSIPVRPQPHRLAQCSIERFTHCSVSAMWLGALHRNSLAALAAMGCLRSLCLSAFLLSLQCFSCACFATCCC